MRNSIKDEKVGATLQLDDKKTIEVALEDTINWLDQNQNADKVILEDKLKQLENTCNPIVAKMYSGGSPGCEVPNHNTNNENRGPKIEEVD